MKKKQQNKDANQDLENQPGLANNASESDGSIRSLQSEQKDPTKILQERPAKGSRPKKDEDRRVLVDITVEVEDGREVHIKMREGDTAEQVAARFCQEQKLPSQLVAPLTEHIVSNIVNISKEDDNTPTVYFQNQRCHGHNYEHALEQEISHSKRIADKENEYKKVKRIPGKKTCFDRKQKKLRKERRQISERSIPKKPKKYLQRQVSERLISSTFTSSAKYLPFEPKRRKQEKLSLKEKEFCTRLYTEFEEHKRKLEEERKFYEDMYEKQIQRAKPVFAKKSRRIMRVRELAAKQFQNYGELLYREALCSLQHRKQLIEIREEEQRTCELEGVTWKPRISKLARQIKCRAGEVWERLQRDKRSETHLQRLRNEALECELMECTFKPQVNQVPSHIKELNLYPVSRFDLLFWDAESRKKRQEQYMRWFPEGVTFTPAVNKDHETKSVSIERKTVRSFLKTEEEKPRENVFTRLLEYATKLTKRKQKPFGSEERQIDPATGQKLFKPLTGRRPLKERKGALSIWDFLYNLKFSNDDKKKALKEKRLQEMKDFGRSQYTSPISERLCKQIEERSLHEVFSFLDKEKDGYVELESADTKLLTNELVEDITEAKKTKSGPLPFEKFAKLMLAVQNSHKEKKQGMHLVLRNWRRKRPLRKFSFDIKINEKSKELAAVRRKFSTREEWYSIVLSDQKKIREKIEALRSEKEQKEMAQCTFTPAILSGTGKSRFKNFKGDNKERVRVEEEGEDDIHGYIIKETKLTPGSHKVDKASSSSRRTKSAADADAHAHAADSAAQPFGLFDAWKRFVTKPPEDNRRPDIEPLHKRKAKKNKEVISSGFLSDFPEP